MRTYKMLIFHLQLKLFNYKCGFSTALQRKVTPEAFCKTVTKHICKDIHTRSQSVFQ